MQDEKEGTKQTVKEKTVTALTHGHALRYNVPTAEFNKMVESATATGANP